jgi:hypothetical protein
MDKHRFIYKGNDIRQQERPAKQLSILGHQ